MVQILQRLQAHYESREMPFGKVYEWHPARLALECDCGEKVTLRGCYELERKSHRNADSAVDLAPSSSPFPAFLSRF